MTPDQKLSPLQLELLKIYSFNPSEEELLEVKTMLAKYFAAKLIEKVDRTLKEKKYILEDFDTILNEDAQ